MNMKEKLPLTLESQQEKVERMELGNHCQTTVKDQAKTSG